MVKQQVGRKELDQTELIQVNYQIPRWVHLGLKQRADKTGMKLHRFVAVVLGAYLTKDGKER